MELTKWSDGAPPMWFIRACVLLVLLEIWAGIFSSIEKQEERERWDAFATAHACKKVGEISRSTQNGIGYGVMSSGQTGTMITTTSTPGKTGWVCDDGVTYWR